MNMGRKSPLVTLSFQSAGAALGVPTLDSPEIVEESPVINPVIPERDNPAREGLPGLVRALLFKASLKAVDTLGSHDSASRI